MPGSTYIHMLRLCGGRERDVYHILYPLDDTIGSTWLSLNEAL